MYIRNSLTNYITFMLVFSFLGFGGYLLSVYHIFEMKFPNSTAVFAVLFVAMYFTLAHVSKRIFNYDPIIDITVMFITKRFKRAIRSLHYYYLFSDKDFNYPGITVKKFKQLDKDKMLNRMVRSENFFKNPFALNGDTIVEWEFKLSYSCVIHVQSIVSSVGINNSSVKMTNIYLNDMHVTVNKEKELAQVLSKEELNKFKKMLYNVHFDSLIAKYKRLFSSKWRYITAY